MQSKRVDGEPVLLALLPHYRTPDGIDGVVEIMGVRHPPGEYRVDH